MKNLLYITLGFLCLLAGCGTDANQSNSKFGTWEKVSASQGNYVGLGNVGHYVKSSTHLSADTTSVDTSYINNAGLISLKLAPVDFTEANYDFTLTLTDSAATFRNYHSEFHYISDSTAFVNTHIFETTNNPAYNSFTLRMQINCNKQQAGQEFVTYKSTSRDSTQAHVYKVRVDGMYKIVDDLVSGCR